MKLSKIIIALAFIGYIIFSVSSCKPSQFITAKSGAQLWGENCVRCHNIPSPNIYSDQQWELAVSHMRLRGNLTKEESDKITEFLQAAN
ncbi:MAG: cytochrome c [Bacteroidetes bacterium]|nr:cytochrome c [Bacteroidota bacterium]MCH8233465.1 cytochrome c [Bacteroidota bacterium]